VSKELIVHSSQHETRLAILEEDQLVELHVENESQHALAGSIYKGRVTRVLPGMQSAFVNIGLERDAFLYVSDFFDESDEEFDQVSVTPASAGKGKPDEASELATVEASGAAAPQNGSTQENSSIQQDGSTQEKGVNTEDNRSGRRDRRGRRSRRRRGKGSSGFPTAKYADVGAEEESKEATPAAGETTDEADETSIQDLAAESGFVVLPGESLAKYTDDPAEIISDSSEETDSPSRGREEAASDESLTGSDISAPAAVESPAGSDDDLETAVNAGRDEVQDLGDELGDPAEASEQDLVVGSATEMTVEEDESPSFLDPDPDSQRVEQLIAEPEQQLEEADRAENTPEDSEVVEAAAATTETEAETDDVQPEDEAPEPQTAELLSEEEASGSTAVAAPGEADEPPQALEAGDEHHAFPGYPGLPLADSDESEDSGEGKASPSISGGDSDESAPESSDSADNSGSRREARVRGDSGSSSFVHRRGRRGRRRSQRQRKEPEKQSSGDAAPAAESGKSNGDSGRKINDLLAKGQEVLVQIAKEPLGKKGARITSHIALPGRFLVYMPTVDHIGVSRKIPSDKERVRLRKIVQTHRTGMPGGFIVRTAGEGVSEEDVRGDMLFLYNQWLDIRDRSDGSPAPALLHHDDDVVERVLRDRVGEDFKTIWVDGESEYERILRFVERFQPDLLKGVKLYTRGKPMFDQFNITAELAKAMRPKVWLKSGGYIVINQTEALVAIDVNTGKYVGKSDRLEDTIVNTNLEAVKEIVRQLRIRDLGGIIVVDFIDMEDRSNRQQVLAAIENDLRADMAPSKVLPFNEFGLVAITRKRVKQSLERALCTPCPYCHGSATVKSVQTVIQDILGEARKMATSKEPTKDITLRVNQEVARKLKSRDNNYVQEIEQIMRGHVLVRSDVSLHREHFDIG